MRKNDAKLRNDSKLSQLQNPPNPAVIENNNIQNCTKLRQNHVPNSTPDQIRNRSKERKGIKKKGNSVWNKEREWERERERETEPARANGEEGPANEIKSVAWRVAIEPRGFWTAMVRSRRFITSAGRSRRRWLRGRDLRRRHVFRLSLSLSLSISFSLSFLSFLFRRIRRRRRTQAPPPNHGTHGIGTEKHGTYQVITIETSF